MSQSQRVLDVLKDGRWHSVPEIHHWAGSMRLNSRVSELRSRGHLIECRTVRGVGPERYQYRLLSGPGIAEARGRDLRQNAPGPLNRTAPAATDGESIRPVQLSLAPPGAYDEAAA